MPKTTVVHVRDGFDVYIGRTCRGFVAQGWQNPFKVTATRSRAEAVDAYRDYLLTRPDLLARLPELRGKRLGCWCKVRGDEPCHGEILAELADAV